MPDRKPSNVAVCFYSLAQSDLKKICSGPEALMLRMRYVNLLQGDPRVQLSNG
jgi:hypothetical protein